MRIAYLGQMAEVSGENGISKKIRAQCFFWQRAGHHVKYFSLTPTVGLWSEFGVDTELLHRGWVVERMKQSRLLTDRIRAWKPDVVYFRYAYHSAGFPGLFAEFPTVAELNSDDLTEYPITLPWPKVIYHRLTRTRILRAVTAFVAVTHELSQRFSRFGKPTEVIGNSIGLREFYRPAQVDPTAPVRLVFVGSAYTPWHGLERVIELAKLFPEFGFDIIGTPKRPGPSNMVWHGYLGRIEYEPLLWRATAAIGTMGLFRKKMEEACPLKVREYLAFGMPVIAGYTDTDVPDNADYFYRLPNNSEPLTRHRPRLFTWISAWRGHCVPRSTVQHLDTSYKEELRLDFLKRIVDGRKAR